MQKKRHRRRPSGRRPQNRNFRNKKALDPSNFIKQAQPVEEIEFIAPLSFSEMDIHESLKETIAKKGYVNPTEIQSKTYEDLVEGRDVVGIANTGTGKTGAFLIPIIQQLLTNNKKFQTLIVLPTRELALQVEQEFKSITKGMKLYSSTLIGGTNVNKDIAKLRRPNDFIIGTPGRILDMMNQKALRLGGFDILVLDEFDRMLDMGFVKDVQKIAAAMPKRKQTMLFSATIDQTQYDLIEELVDNPFHISVSSGTTSTDSVEQDIVKVGGRDKLGLLTSMLENKEFKKVLIFAETKRTVNKLNQQLRKKGIRTDMIHGDKSQNYRVSALRKFKNSNIQVLIATDVVARGIDISDITHVINYQPPTSMDSYIHRIGRTGRAGKMGHAYTFID
ncbi:DEAD/DEAH box helicase [Parvicella tangerina]|uniref:ATP-dependent RNA helicase RhlE n=1 Tax=Parvicella tangerina TaxID=2829795 RepID=A0A916NJR8_9FLAO|nr:DEAD/DEAH box helicase [Parvicella tangerina]CAG5087483.1 ATP-dependent RNA helicase RhlE [Parvicella tangerina]